MIPEILRKLLLIENYNLIWEYGLTYAIISILIAVLVLVVYYFSRDHIRSSTSRSAKLSYLQSPKDLLSGVRFYFISILSIPILNIISNLSGLLIEGCALKIGFGSIFGTFILLFLIYGLFRLVLELFDINDLPGNRFINNYSKFHLIFGSIMLLTLLANVIFIDETYLDHSTILFAIVYLSVTAVNMYKLNKISWISKPDPVKRIRFRLIIINYFTLILTLIIELLIRLQSDQSIFWLEELGFLFDGIVLLLIFNFYLIIFLPETFRRIVKIPNQELALYKDMRIDLRANLYKWYQLSMDVSKKQASDQIHQSNFVIFHSFLEEDQNQVCKALGMVFGTQYAMNPSGYAEPFFNKEILPKSNLFFLIDPVDPFLEKIVDRIYLDYNFKIEFWPNLCINNFEYPEDDVKYIPFFITPLINLETGIPVSNILKSWIIIAEEKYHEIISEFINNFYPYFNAISKKSVVICVLRFPIIGGEISNIPHGPESGLPNFEYIIRL